MRHHFATWGAVVAALGCVLVVGCGSSAPHPGGLFVTVKDLSMATVADAVVTTEPASESIATDALGSALFRKLPAGFYSVTAVHPSFGAARAPVTIEAGALAELTLTLRKDLVLDAGASPDLGAGAGGAPGPTTGIGGGTGTGGGGGRSDAGGASDAGDAGVIDPSLTIALADLTKDSNGVNLSWTATGTFASYRIYRARDAGSFEVINILNAPPALTYRDETPQLGASYRFRVGGLTAQGQEVLSNTQMITAGVFIEVGSQVERMRADPTRPYLYLLDRVNNSLHFVNLSTNTVSSTIFVGSTPADLGINLAGTELYIANFGASEIAVVSLATQMKVRSLLVDTSIGTWDGNPFRLAPTAGDTLVFTSEDQWNNLKLVTATTGTSIVATGSLYEPCMAASPDGRRLYVGEFGISTANMVRFDVSGTALTQVDSVTPIGGANSREVLVTGDGTYVFWSGRKYLANNLKSLLGTFSESILAVNHDGTIAIGPTKIFDGATFSARKPLPLSTMVMALSADEKTVYLYDMMTSRIYLYGL